MRRQQAQNDLLQDVSTQQKHDPEVTSLYNITIGFIWRTRGEAYNPGLIPSTPAEAATNIVGFTFRSNSNIIWYVFLFLVRRCIFIQLGLLLICSFLSLQISSVLFLLRIIWSTFFFFVILYLFHLCTPSTTLLHTARTDIYLTSTHLLHHLRKYDPKHFHQTFGEKWSFKKRLLRINNFICLYMLNYLLFSVSCNFSGMASFHIFSSLLSWYGLESARLKPLCKAIN